MSTPIQSGPGYVRPGLKTTEFYQTLLTQVLAAVVAILTIFGVHFNLDGVQSLIPAAAVLAAAIAQSFYSRSRASVKVAAVQAAVSGADSVDGGPSSRPANPGVDSHPPLTTTTPTPTPTTFSKTTPRPSGSAVQIVDSPEAGHVNTPQDQTQLVAEISTDLRRIYQLIQSLGPPTS